MGVIRHVCVRNKIFNVPPCSPRCLSAPVISARDYRARDRVGGWAPLQSWVLRNVDDVDPSVIAQNNDRSLVAVAYQSARAKYLSNHTPTQSTRVRPVRPPHKKALDGDRCRDPTGSGTFLGAGAEPFGAGPSGCIGVCGPKFPLD